MEEAKWEKLLRDTDILRKMDASEFFVGWDFSPKRTRLSETYYDATKKLLSIKMEINDSACVSNKKCPECGQPMCFWEADCNPDIAFYQHQDGSKEHRIREPRIDEAISALYAHLYPKNLAL